MPNYTETDCSPVMWSEHCPYKNSKTSSTQISYQWTLHVLQGPGEGAGIVDIGDGLAVVSKQKVTTHPSAVEPYEGAATGVGGITLRYFQHGGLVQLRY